MTVRVRMRYSPLLRVRSQALPSKRRAVTSVRQARRAPWASAAARREAMRRWLSTIPVLGDRRAARRHVGFALTDLRRPGG
jgi:hypothetical protein